MVVCARVRARVCVYTYIYCIYAMLGRPQGKERGKTSWLD